MQYSVPLGYRGIGELAALPVLKAHEQIERLAAVLGDEQIERRTAAPVLFDRVADEIYLPVPGEHKIDAAVVVRHLRAVSSAPCLALIGRIAAVYPAARGSCEHMHISYSTSWNLIRTLESQLHEPLISRSQGGVNGSHSELTPYGEEFLKRYARFSEETRNCSEKIFENCFRGFFNA